MEPLSRIDILDRSRNAGYRVVGDGQSGSIEFLGRGQGELIEAKLKYPLLQWSKLPSKCTSKTLHIVFKLNHIGDKHTEVVGRFLKTVEELIQEQSFKVTIHWFCDASDEEMIEVGEDFLYEIQGATCRHIHIPVVEEEESLFPEYGGELAKDPDFHIETKRYKIYADQKKGYLALSGAFVADTFPNFIELQEWSRANLASFPNKHINVFMKITYLDNSSRLSLKGMFRGHELLIRDEGFTANYYWYNDEDDEDLMEEAETLSYQCITSFWNCGEDDDEDMIEKIQESFRKGNGGNAGFKYIEISE